MTGRYSLCATEKEIQSRFQVAIENYQPIYNAAPLTPLPMIHNEEPNKLTMATWGLVPHWKKTVANAIIQITRTEAKHNRGLRRPVKRRRCLIPADGFYEWKEEQGKKVPYRVQLESKRLFTMAGYWDTWDQGSGLISFCLVIEAAPEDFTLAKKIPLILTTNDEQSWLHGEKEEALNIQSKEKLESYRVSTLVNSPENNIREVTTRL